MNKHKYGLGYLKGRAEGFRRSLLTIANVEGAAKMAARYGVADHDIAAVLVIYGLAWDGSKGLVTTNAQATGVTTPGPPDQDDTGADSPL